MDIVDTQDKVELNNTQIAIDYGNPAGTSRELNKHLPGIAAKYEVKLGENTDYKACPKPSSEGDQINVQAVGPSDGYKGYRHYISSVTANDRVNRITIYGQVTNGIDQNVLEQFTFETSGGVYVYFPLDTGGTPELEKPLLICLSQNGDNTGNNTWYERQSGTAPGSYTWTTANGLDGKNPTDISGLADKLQDIKSTLNEDTGYPNPADGNDNLNDQEGDASGIEIQIDKTGDYKSGTSNTETVKVFLKNNEPMFGYTCYTHKVQGGTGQYKKMQRANLKKGSSDLTKPRGAGGTERDTITESNVHYVHVYYFGDRPILIYVGIGNGDSVTNHTYYKPDYMLYNPYADTTKWKVDGTISGSPKTNAKLENELNNLTFELIGYLLL